MKHPLNAPFPTKTTDSGMETSVTFAFAKANAPILDKTLWSSNSMVSKAAILEKARSPIDCTVFGISNSAIFVLLNA